MVTRNSSTVSPVSTRLRFSVNQNSLNWPWKWLNLMQKHASLLKNLAMLFVLSVASFPDWLQLAVTQDKKPFMGPLYFVHMLETQRWGWAEIRRKCTCGGKKKNLHFVAVCFAWRCVEVNHISVLTVCWFFKKKNTRPFLLLRLSERVLKSLFTKVKPRAQTFFGSGF